MAAKQGREFLLRQGTLESGTNVAGLRATSFSIGTEAVDITNKDSNGYRTLLEGAGTLSLSITAEGVYDDAVVNDTLRGYAMAGSINTFTIIFNSNGTTADTLQASFLITSYERAGDHNNEETFTLTLESSGAWTYAADQAL